MNCLSHEHLAVVTEDLWIIGEMVGIDDPDSFKLHLFKEVTLPGYEHFSL